MSSIAPVGFMVVTYVNGGVPNRKDRIMATKTKKTGRKGKGAKRSGATATKAKGGTKTAPAVKNATRAKRGGDGGKRASALDAAAVLLKKAGKPMRSRELVTAMAEQGLWKSPAGKTPHATLYAAILRDIQKNGGASRFRKVDRGQFAFVK